MIAVNVSARVTALPRTSRCSDLTVKCVGKPLVELSERKAKFDRPR
jgi:hypothetical protein